MEPGTDLQSAASRFVQRLKAEFPGAVEQVVLYGSVARGDAGPDSDVDLIVVTKDKSRVERHLSSLIGEWIKETGRILQVFVVTQDEYKAMMRRESAFAHALRDEGVALEG